MTAHGVSVHLDDCGKTYPDGTVALESTRLDIARGETIVFLGPSGCGKTTLLRIIAGLEQPDAGGRIRFGEDDVTGTPIERRNVGMVFQSYALFPNMNVAENIGYGLKIRGVSRDERAQRIGELIKLTGIEGLEQRSVGQLSGGQRQRVALARAVAVRPRVLLLDEPLTALDALLRERLRGELNSLLRALGITTIYVTHDQAEAMALGDRIVVMGKGAIAQVGTPRDIYFTPATRYVAEFVGAANIIEATARDGRLVLPGGSLPVATGAVGQVVAMVRPESLSIHPPDKATLTGRVESVSFVGDRQRVNVTGAADTPILIDAPNSLAITPGEQVGVGASAGAVRLLAGERQ